MDSLPPPANEIARLEALRRYHLLDTAPEACFDDFTQLAARICGTPISLISLLDENRQWFKSRVGIEAVETPREMAFCDHAITDPHQVMVVDDAAEDQRFCDNPLVASDPHIRFYAGAPLVTGDGYALGTLCVIDRQPRTLSDADRDSLARLGRRVVAQMELRRTSDLLAAAVEQVRTLEGLLPICAHCKSVRDDSGYWTRVEDYLKTCTGSDCTHGICPQCLRKHFPDIAADVLSDTEGVS